MNFKNALSTFHLSFEVNELHVSHPICHEFGVEVGRGWEGGILRSTQGRNIEVIVIKQPVQPDNIKASSTHTQVHLPH